MYSERYVRTFGSAAGVIGQLYSLPALERDGYGAISRLPVSLRILLESLLRHADSTPACEAQLRQLASWQPQALRDSDIPFMPARVLLQDFTGVPLLCDLAAMRDAVHALGGDAGWLAPQVPVHLVVDHSVQVDFFREANALALNMAQEYTRNAERYRFIKWGVQAFDKLQVSPPGLGIVHQVNLEHLAPGLGRRGEVCFPDSVVGTDSHTTMINALGVLGWGVGGIEAEAAILGLPVTLLIPDVVGVQLEQQLPHGVSATDLALALTAILREENVLDCFVEFFGAGCASLTVPDRATLANMAPEYGATVAFFPPDEQSVAYLAATGRDEATQLAFRHYYQAQNMFGTPLPGMLHYSRTVRIDLSRIQPCVAGPRLPQEHKPLGIVKQDFLLSLGQPVSQGGFGQITAPRLPLAANPAALRHGDILIAAITSCTNTANPGSMLAAGLLARNAVLRGLRVAPHIKTSLAPGSRVVSDYLARADLLAPLGILGFRVVAYGCTTCIGNAGPLDPALEAQVSQQGLVCVAVLSGNRNFEARIHPALRANYLMSPALVVAYALAGRIDIDLAHEPLGHDATGAPVYLHELWPSPLDTGLALQQASHSQPYRQAYLPLQQPQWAALPVLSGQRYPWPASSYIVRPPFVAQLALACPAIAGLYQARALALLGDAISTDHISPAGPIAADSCAGRYLYEQGIAEADFNSYGSRRGNHQVMMRGCLANPRLRNLMLPPDNEPQGGITLHQPDAQRGFIYDIAMRYRTEQVPLVVFAGHNYGTGSSRDWAAKGMALLGVRAVIARSFERIHRSNLVGMGVLPLEFQGQDSVATLQLHGRELFDLPFIEDGIRPGMLLTLQIYYPNGQQRSCTLRVRIDTEAEATYYRHGGLMPYLVRTLISKASLAPQQVPA
ncbi:aconitate hydratase AcnA [Vogesella mureinivorans]|uniref:aconitate hydratase AcnA n=1 Tax=Vogesella mureinivorans TaxID=657276 RepID=UPI0011C948F5|nr:aconitate hydratase AcnA [Vogesella mureinivorans]